MNELDVLDVIASALRSANDSRINDISVDNDNHDGEIILTLDDGKDRTCWVIRSKDFEETDLPGEEG